MTSTLPTRGQFWTAGGVAGLSLWASGAPSALYPHYAAEWGLPTSVTTAVFAIYPAVLVPVLLVFGGVSDYIGRRASMLIGVTAIALGALLLAVAPDVGWVFAGRALTAAGVGLSLSPATAAMVDAGGSGGAARASSATTVATASGLALATLVSGAFLQFLPDPLHLSFWTLVALAVLIGTAVWFMPRHPRMPAQGRWRPVPPRVPRSLRLGFAAATLGVTSAYAFGAIFLSLAAQVAKDLVHSENDLVNGAILSVSAIAIGASALVFRRLAPRVAIAVGSGAVIVALILLVAAGLSFSLPLFLASSLVGGLGYSLLFSGGLGVLTATAPAHHRAGMLSSAYTVAYLLQAVVALGVGGLATASGLQLALEVGTIAVSALALAAVTVAYASRRTVAAVA